MKYKEIHFDNRNRSGSHVDIVGLREVLARAPEDHSQFDFHKVSFYVILLVTSGDGLYNLNFKDYSFREGTLFTLRKDTIHKFYECDADGFLVLFTDKYILDHSNKLEASEIFLLFNDFLSSPHLQCADPDYEQLVTLVDLMRDEYHGKNDNQSAAIVRRLLQVMLSKLFRIKSKETIPAVDSRYLALFQNFQEQVEHQFAATRAVSDYARKLGVSTKTLNNVTRRIIQRPAKALINDIVIAQAKQLIIDSTDSLTDIAYRMGFDEPTNFFKYFTRYEGMTPSQFRSICSPSSKK